jgi:hypothetical protein
MRNRFGAAAAAVVFVLSACDGTTTGPEDDAVSARADVIAMFLADFDASGGVGYGLHMDPRSGTRTFSMTSPCPAGGTRSVSGSSASTFDNVAHVLSTTWTTTQSQDACAFEHARRGQAVTVVIDGSVTAAGSASYQLPSERGAPRTLLSYSSTRQGSTTTTAGDQSRTCDVDVTESYDAATGTFTIKGVVCGRDVDVTRTPGQKARG